MLDIETLIWLIPALPLAAAIVTALFGRALGEQSHWPPLFGVAGAFVLSLVLLTKVHSEASAFIPAPPTGHDEHGAGHDGVGHQDHGAAHGAETPKVAAAKQPAGDEPADTEHANPESGDVPPPKPKQIGYEKTVTLWTWAVVPRAHSPSRVSPEYAVDRAPAVPTDLDISVTLRTDPLTSMMLVVITLVGTLVVIYSSGYMHGDPGYPRFFAYLGLFVFSMTMLVSSSNFVLLYVFWEAVGVCSYLLIGFWFQKPEAAEAGKKAFLVNRVGDVGLALAIFLIWLHYGTVNFHDSVSSTGVVSQGLLGQTRLADPHGYEAGGEAVTLAICLLLMLAACGKSAQFPLYVWLPDAMEGPTPVSALIHAATMVTAGVYLVTRTSPLFVVSATAQLTVAAIGAFTALLAGLIALTQTDLKRVLAYSTVSQLGYMFLGLGVGTASGITAGMFHLFTHAFFKALLFLAAGSVMHAMGGIIDMRRFGGLRKVMPITHWTFLIGALALAGVPPLAGFWSKDAILGACHDAFHHPSAGDQGALRATLFLQLYYVGVFTAGLTAFYTFRAYFLTFQGEERIPHEAGHHAHESPPAMSWPLIVLAIGAVVVGGLFNSSLPLFLQATPSLASLPAPHPGGAMHMDVAVISSCVGLAGIGLAAFLYLGGRQEVSLMGRVLKPLVDISYNKFYVDEFYMGTVVWPIRLLAKVSAWCDKWILDGLVNFVGQVPVWSGSALRWTANGLVQSYAMAMAIGLLLLMGVLMAG